MWKRYINILSVVVVSLIAVSCSSTSHIYPEGDFKFMILSDIHITNSESKDKRLGDLIGKVNENYFPGLEVFVTTGDNVSSVYDHYYPDSLNNSYNRLSRFAEIVADLEIPYYLTMGNHEYKIDKERDSDAPYEKEEILEMEKIWVTTTGFQPYYSKIYKGWKFIILNSMTGRASDRFFDETQLNWFNEELKDDLPAIVFFHHPLRTDDLNIWAGPSGIISKADEPEFYEILESHEKNIKGIFVGHGHRWVHDKLFDTIDVYETDSFGDNEESPFYIVGIDIENQKIHVAQSPVVLK